MFEDITRNTLPEAMFETAVNVTSGVDVSGYHHSTDEQTKSRKG